MLQEANVTNDVIDPAFSSFILEIMANHGEPAPRLCSKDPYSFMWLEYLSRLFPNTKFVLMIRDGRAIVHSMISRNLTEADWFSSNDPRKSLQEWNRDIGVMYDQCSSVGDHRCFLMHYEHLILRPEENMRKLLDFLGLPWNDSVLHHERFLGTEIFLGE